jgi:hypothetical protein
VLYHVGSKPLYNLIGETDNRNRRQHQVFTIKCRIMSLDFVLQHRHCRFFPTEREKIELFCENLQLDVSCLPMKRYRATNGSNTTDRYFVDKFPIFVVDGDSLVHFTYVDEGLHSTSGFERFLEQYEGLLRALPKCCVVYVAAFQDQFPRAKRAFERFLASRSARPPIDPQVRRLLEYFRDRSAYDRRELKAFTQAKLIQFREDRSAFAGVEYERMFNEWMSGGDEAVLSRFGVQTKSISRSVVADFRAHILPFDYRLFGTLGDRNWQGRSA